MTPPESPDESDEGFGALAGSRPSSEIAAYGGKVSSVWVVTHPAAKTSMPATITIAAKVDFHHPLTRLSLGLFGHGIPTDTAVQRALDASKCCAAPR
jgi:hypothetical protein